MNHLIVVSESLHGALVSLSQPSLGVTSDTADTAVVILLHNIMDFTTELGREVVKAIN